MKTEYRGQNAEDRLKESFYLPFVLCLLISLLCILSSDSWADTPTTITSDYMEHFKDEDKYVATGNVKLVKDNTVIYADKAVLFEKAAYVQLEGHVIYEDSLALINAERAELSVDTTTGKMYNAVILLKNQPARGVEGTIDIWINSNKVEKIDDTHYYAPTATFTSCETIAESEGRYKDLKENKIFSADNPDWCFKGSNVDILLGNRIAGNNMVYRVKGLPALYTPYFRVPIGKERETGLLSPIVGNSSVNGFHLGTGFFWAIDENKDATLSLDYYSKRGVGTGAEYRYIDPDEKGKWSVYHLNDSVENKTNYVIKGLHDEKFGDIKAYADINFVNQWDYYNQFSTKRTERIERYTQSNAEVSVPLSDSRLYLLGQYWVDLQNQGTQPTLAAPIGVPQRLPELGYVVNTKNIGPLMFSMNSSIASFSRTTEIDGRTNIDPALRNLKEVGGQRLDINPTVSYSFGNQVQVFQSLSARETAYNLTDVGAISNEGTSFLQNPHRETFTYTANALTRFFRQYESGTNIIEPSIGYTFGPKFSHPLPLFDSVDLNSSGAFSPATGTAVLGNFTQPAPQMTVANQTALASTSTAVLLNKTSLAQLSVLDTLALKNINLSARLTQPYDLTAVAPAHALQPTVLSVSGTSGPIGLNMSASEDLNTMTEQSFATTLSATVMPGTTAYVSRYFSTPSTEQYNVGVTTVLSKTLTANGNVWYDNSVGLRDYTLHTIYTSQCWGVDVEFLRRPPDTIHPPEYSFILNFVLKGIGGLPPYEYTTSTTQTQ